MNNYEYLCISTVREIFYKPTTKIVKEASSPNIHDLEDLEKMLHEIGNPAIAVEKLNQVGWELVSIYGAGHFIHYALKRLKTIN